MITAADIPSAEMACAVGELGTALGAKEAGAASDRKPLAAKGLTKLTKGLCGVTGTSGVTGKIAFLSCVSTPVKEQPLLF